MMSNAKTLAEHQREGTFSPAKHLHLLDGEAAEKMRQEIDAWWDQREHVRLWRETMSDDECVQRVAELGYDRAAGDLGVSSTILWKRLSKAGRGQDVRALRGRVSIGMNAAAAAVLGVSVSQVIRMRGDGRLPKVLTLDYVERRAASRLALVPFEATAAVASRYNLRWKRCPACDSFFYVKPSWARSADRGFTCSQKCSGALRSRRAAPKLKIIQVRAVKRKPLRRFFSCSCQLCGETFLAKGRPWLYCSKKCMDRVGRDVRKARERGATKVERVYRRKVFERDKWRCHFCGGKIDKRLTGEWLSIGGEDSPLYFEAHPRSATLEHVHPRSFEGPHTYGNVRAAHKDCNERAGNRSEFQMCMAL